MLGRIFTSGLLREPAALAVILLALALPIIVVLYLAHVLVGSQSTRNSQDIADRLVLWSDASIEQADRIIRERLAEYPHGCPPSYVDELARTVFGNDNISAIGIIRDGKLVCANSRLRADSLLIGSEADRIPPNKTSVTFMPDDAAYHTPAIMVARRIDAHTVGVALIEPGYFLLPLNFIPGGGDLQVALLGANGEVYAGNSSLLNANRPDVARGVRDGAITITNSKRFPISVAIRRNAEHDRERWHQALPYALAGGLLLGLASSFLVAASLLRSRTIPTQLRTALTRQEFFIEYLPTVNLSDGQCTGAEALIRWDHPDHGLIPPNVFIPIAEASGLVVPITKWILSKVASDLHDLSKLDLPADFMIGVNLASQYISDDIIMAAQQIFRSHDVSLSHVMFELSERGLIDHANKPVQDLLKTLRRLGAKIALDDFGTGSSNLAYLQSFEVDYLKIDKQFVAALGKESVTSGLVKTIVDVGKHLNVIVIAEGIEDAKQLALLRSLDVHEGQGWYFSKPLRFPAFKAWLAGTITK